MINGFTNETKPLSEYERDTLTPIIVQPAILVVAALFIIKILLSVVA